MLLSVDNPVYNTIIVFSVIMILLYLTKPDTLYDSERNEFRQFGTTNGKTLLPIYVVGILLAIILYVFFFHVSAKYGEITINKSKPSKKYILYEPNNDDEYRYIIQQQQINQLQNQLRQIMQQQNNTITQ